jgi:predicted Na+-dependent transporter
MLEHYKKRFWGMQTLIAAVTLGVFFVTGHLVLPAAMFFFTMQLASVLGAAWASRLKRKYQARGW